MARPRWIHRLSLWGPPLLYAALIFHLSSESNPLPPLTAIVWDKALHATEYAGLAVLVLRAVIGGGSRTVTALVIAIALTSAYGASDEWHQLFVPGRDSDYHDWIADTCGAAAGAAAYLTIHRTLARSRRAAT